MTMGTREPRNQSFAPAEAGEGGNQDFRFRARFRPGSAEKATTISQNAIYGTKEPDFLYLYMCMCIYRAHAHAIRVRAYTRTRAYRVWDMLGSRFFGSEGGAANA